MSGHSKWSTIKHRKGAADAKRGQVFTKVIKEITVAARSGGGDPGANPRLRRALDEAKANNMPQENVTRAIKKGTGELEGVNYEELTYEGVGPLGALFVIEAVTDNRNRTTPELRKVFDKHNGQLGSSGTALWAFDEKGLITVPKALATEEQLFDIAVGAGAEDIQLNEEAWHILTPRDSLEEVREALLQAQLIPASVSLEKVPKTPKIVSETEAEPLLHLLEALEDHDDVQKVSADFQIVDNAS
ncbi:MAG: YebC/PmpR family DNA-binding transcriptional regulator [Myxococcales bacterium]|nr:YebC/PmpR family DNA-binding transcriptional regulator [Myxococcales bacterium]MCB9707547.1 YebC/PmpR family DNA-binding transcriptional regulator [Myxococcales bacterium]